MPLKYPLIPMRMFANGAFMALVGVAAVASVSSVGEGKRYSSYLIPRRCSTTHSR